MTLTEAPNRRASARFPLQHEVRYSLILTQGREQPLGSGRTVNISSSGILFTTDQILFPGNKLKLEIAWPAQLEGRISLKLVVFGQVIRFEQGRGAVAIDRYEFRTQATAPVRAAVPSHQSEYAVPSELFLSEPLLTSEIPGSV